MRKQIMIIVCFLAAIAMQAQTTSDTKDSKKKEKKINIGGSVYDSFTRSKLPAFITLMDQDSTVVDTMTCHVSERGSWSCTTSMCHGWKRSISSRLRMKGIRTVMWTLR
ncbi:MAG: hypothetical protein Q4E71_06755 [Prevotella sp.]|nr:hypothetical protein [Prevotella sp.]